MPSNISGMSYVRLGAPDLGRMEHFLEDFGMVKVHRDATRLYMRGVGESPFLHVTELGDPGVIAFGYEARDPDVLTALSQRTDAQGLEHVDAPGGGRRVRLRDPNGLCVEIVAAREPVARLTPRVLIREAEGESRVQGPARVERIAHTAYATPNLQAMIAWYQDALGVIPTDELYVDTPDNVLGQFDRVDLGEAPVDHHVIFLLRGPRAGMHHVSYQVEGVDDIFFGFDHMTDREHGHVRGIGRHALGSQIFNYWMSPYEQMHEHWISHEKLNAKSKFNRIKIGEGMSHDTGERPSERFVKQATPIVAANV
ncbi:VOC family protein [Chitinasiproducens palmae]|uniref:Glyoxalase/Bleomycin resistance protein/Dioxygenase superfamily protein n=1 Tax=Chitinasiproducens palmae TaxID=1770053 RepID=A0A1H2PTW8_9BURK|nr:VOC family protein [Chitinasiproducens palmae]SDV50602.1 Glyoxalase/Bleomycin resistance protein/Dioxygenase superfamily protein [Chitinasiproducens palmae]